MKRTTVMLPDDLAYLIDRERRRRGVSTAAIVREAVAAHFNITPKPRKIPFAGIGRSGLTDVSENFERYLDEEWGSEEFFNRIMGRYAPEDFGESTVASAPLAPNRDPRLAQAGRTPERTDEDGEVVGHGD